MARPAQFTQSANAASSPVGLNYHITPQNTVVRCTVTGTVNYTVQWCYQDMNNVPGSFYAYQSNAPTLVWVDDSVVAGLTTSAVATNTLPATGVRINKASGSGSVDVVVLQAGIAGP